MKTIKRIIAEKGKWYRLDDNQFIHTCCSCGVEHKVESKITAGKVALRWFPYKKAPHKLNHGEMIEELLERNAQ